MSDLISSQWAITFLAGVISYLGHRLWTKADDKQKALIASVFGEIKSIVQQLVLTAPAGTTTEQVIIWAKGAIAIQAAKRGLTIDGNPVLQQLADEIVADAVKQFMALHPEPSTLVPPIKAKL